MSKLSSDSGRWMLSCKINDGTEACDVDLSDRVCIFRLTPGPEFLHNFKGTVLQCQIGAQTLPISNGTSGPEVIKLFSLNSAEYEISSPQQY